MSVLDAHVHVWDPEALEYPWLAGHAALGRAHLPAQIDDAEGLVSEWVFVEADPAPGAGVAEARWVDGLDWPGLVGIVAHLELDAADIQERLDDLSRIPRVRGVRHILEGQPDDKPWPLGLAAGLEAVAARGLTFDACVRWPQLPRLVEFLSRVPRATVVLDHIGKPPVDAGLDSDDGRRWLDGIRRLADLPAVSVKLSGLAAEATSAEILAENGPAFLAAALELFGADRCLFASDWPVSGTPAGGVATDAWYEMVRDAVPGHERDAVFGGTARRVYRLATDA